MPGLWDAHVHYFGTCKIGIDEIYRTPPATAGARIAQDLRATVSSLSFESLFHDLNRRKATFRPKLPQSPFHSIIHRNRISGFACSNRFGIVEGC